MPAPGRGGDLNHQKRMRNRDKKHRPERPRTSPKSDKGTGKSAAPLPKGTLQRTGEGRNSGREQEDVFKMIMPKRGEGPAGRGHLFLLMSQEVRAGLAEKRECAWDNPIRRERVLFETVGDSGKTY